MKKIKKMQFDQPVIIGALSGSDDEPPKGIAIRLARHPESIAYLPFQVESRHLKNTVVCMQLMDIAGLTIADDHQKRIARCIPKLEKTAIASGTVDTVTRRGNNFVGHNVMEDTILDWLKKHSLPGKEKRAALIVGDDPRLPSIKGALISEGWSIRRLTGRTPREPALIVTGALSRDDRRRIDAILDRCGRSCLSVDLGNRRSAPARKGKKLEIGELTRLYYNATVKLLTSHM